MSLSWGDLGILKAARNKQAAEVAGPGAGGVSPVSLSLYYSVTHWSLMSLPPAHISPLKTDQCCHSCDRQTQPRVSNLNICDTALSPRH